MNLHRPRLACFSLFLNLELFWRNNKTIIEFGFRGIRRILQISEGVIHLGRQHPPRSAAFFISYESRIQSLLIVPLQKISLNSKLSQPTWTSKKIAPPLSPTPAPTQTVFGIRHVFLPYKRRLLKRIAWRAKRTSAWEATKKTDRMWWVQCETSNKCRLFVWSLNSATQETYSKHTHNAIRSSDFLKTA